MSFIDEDAEMCRGDYERDEQLDREMIERAEAAPPAGSWHEVAPPTDVDAAPVPVLDPELLRGARKNAGEAEALLAFGEPWNALAKARQARELLDHAIRAYERAAFVTELVGEAVSSC